MKKLKLRIHTFGGLQYECDRHTLQLPVGKARDLLAYLISRRNHPISRDILAGTFWPDEAEESARRMLSYALWQLRSSLGPAADRLATKKGAITFALHSDDWLDVAEFDEVYSSFASHSLDQHSSLVQAVALYQGDFLEGCYDDWAIQEQERLREMYLEMLEWLITYYKQRGEYKEALAYAQQIVAADPLRESAHQELMRLYHLLDRDRAALEQCETLRRTRLQWGNMYCPIRRAGCRPCL